MITNYYDAIGRLEDMLHDSAIQEDINAIKLAVEAIKKQVPKKPIIKVIFGAPPELIVKCPTCKKAIEVDWELSNVKYQHHCACGQTLDWRMSDNEPESK